MPSSRIGPHLEQMVSAARILATWLVLGSAVGLACGAAAALFLHLLAAATATRELHHELIWALPLAGLALGALWQRLGEPIRAGSSLVIDTVYRAGPPLPLRLAPMVLLGTVWTHLFGGSAGREGTAVQMGASLADALAQRLRVAAPTRHLLLVAGVAGGFGAVFGTPIAGAVFALEVVVAGRIDGRGLAPALIAALVGDFTARALRVSHGAFPSLPALPLGPLVASKWLLVALAVAAVAILFLEGVHWLGRRLTSAIPNAAFRMAAGGAALVVAWQVCGTSDYLGLGLPLIERALGAGEVPAHAFALKLAFTVLTLAAGFVGGEVTPLFAIGATLGHALAAPLGLPTELCAGVCMAALFGAAANTPWALAVMAAELFGGAVLPHAALVCAVAYLCTGRRGLYGAQRWAQDKLGGPLPEPVALSELRTKSADPPS